MIFSTLLYKIFSDNKRTVWILHGCHLSSPLCASCCPALGPPAMNTQHRVYNIVPISIDAGIRTSFSFENIEGKHKGAQRIWSYLQQDCLLLCCFYKVLVFTPRWAGSELIVWIVVDSCCFQISRPPWSRRSSMINTSFANMYFWQSGSELHVP